MGSENSRPFIVLRDSLALRRAAFCGLLIPWANENNLEILATGTALEPEERSVDPALVILVLGGTRVEDHGARAQILQQRRLWPDVPMALISDLEDRSEVSAAFREGARGFIPTTLAPDRAIQALGFILAGGTFFPPNVLERSGRERSNVDGAERQGHENLTAHSLTPRQLDVLALLREGKSNKLIARDLSMCESTVKVHVRQIMRKLGAANRTQAALSGIGMPRSRSGDGRSERSVSDSDRRSEASPALLLTQPLRAR